MFLNGIQHAYQALREMVTNLEQADTEGDTTNGNNSEAASGETSPAHKKLALKTSRTTTTRLPRQWMK